MDLGHAAASNAIPAPHANEKAINILARSLFRQMRDQGYSAEQIIGLSSALIELVRADLSRGAGAQ